MAPTELAGVDALMREAGVAKLPTVKRVVLVGIRISPGNPTTKDDGTVVRTSVGRAGLAVGRDATHTRASPRTTSAGRAPATRCGNFWSSTARA